MAIFTIATSVLAAGGFTGAITIAGLSPALSSVVLQVGKGLLWSAAGQALAGGSGSASRQEVQAVSNQAIAPRVRGWGLNRLGGVRAFFEAEGGVLHQLVVFHNGPVHSIEGWTVDGDLVVLDGQGITTAAPGANDLRGKVQIRVLPDAIEGGAYPDLKTAFPTSWTDDHKLEGLATFYARLTNPGLENLSKVFPKQSATLIQVDAELSEVFDPRTSTVVYSDNAGLAIRDYLTHPDGWAIAATKIDDGTVATFADICDQTVPLKTGGNERRYRLAGFYSFEESRKTVLARMLDVCDGQVYQTPEGKVGLLGGQYSEPDVTITDRDVLKVEAKFGRDPFQDFNVFKGIYVSPDHKFEDQECAARRNEVLITKAGRKPVTVPLPMCPSHSQAQRLLKTYEMRTQPEATLRVTTNLVGMKARFPKGDGIHTIRLQIDDLDFDEVVEVKSHSYSVVDKICVMDVATVTNAWLWTPSTEEGAAPPPLSDLTAEGGGDVVPTGLTLSLEPVAIDASTNAAIVVAQVDNPNREDLQLIAEIQVTGTGVWEPMTVGLGSLRAVSNVVSDGTNLTVRVRFAGQTNLPNGEDDYPMSTITAVSNPIAPSSPTLEPLSAAAGTVTIDWINPATNYTKTRIFRSDADSFGGASIVVTLSGDPGLAGSHNDAPGVGTWYYWAVALNGSDVASAPSSSQSITIT